MDKVNVAYTIDEEYISILGVVLLSLRDNNEDVDIDVYVVMPIDTINDENNNPYSNLETDHFKVYIIRIDEKKYFSGYKYKKIAHISKATIFRLFIDKVIPHNINRIIYMDADTLNVGEISSLYHYNMCEKVVGAVVEVAEEDIVFIDSNQRYLYGYYESKDELLSKYFNAGVLLIDLQKYRANEIGDKCIELLKNHAEFVCADQDALNIVLKDNVCYLNPRWNRIWRRELADGSIGTGCLSETLDDIRIVHYCTGWKPWRDPEYKLSDYFWKKAYNSPWYPELIKRMKARLEEDSDTWQYRFPWEKVNAGKSIVIYGAGKVGHAFYTQMMRTKYCEVLYFVDREKTSIEENKARVIGLSELADVYVGEQIVVAIGDATIRKKAAEELSSTININQNLIIYNYKI